MESVQAEVAYIGFLPNPYVHGAFLISSHFVQGFIHWWVQVITALQYSLFSHAIQCGQTSYKMSNRTMV